jgi:hypothetical protein
VGVMPADAGSQAGHGKDRDGGRDEQDSLCHGRAPELSTSAALTCSHVGVAAARLRLKWVSIRRRGGPASFALRCCTHAGVVRDERKTAGRQTHATSAQRGGQKPRAPRPERN